ncbi:conserved hypothetical protein [Acidobacteriia bacterium SbA2]|nr:conserved hypothetical protein [Acidobacteriia bacterium SbA2]
MAAIIGMLRGVNVGPHNRISMEALRALCGSLDLEGAETYVQSGNVVFRSKERNLNALTKRFEDAFEKKFGFPALLVLRTVAEMRTVIANNPFATRKEIEPGKFHVLFLTEEISPEARKQLEATKVGPEEIKTHGRELYIYYQAGAGQSKLPAVMDRILKKTGTARNWNSVTNLLEMADKLEGSPGSLVMR